MAQRVEVGHENGLQIRLVWTDAGTARTAAEATRGSLLLWVGGTLVWGRGADGGEKPFEWTWVELLEFLTYSWAYLAFEEEYPLGLRPETPADLRNRFRLYLQRLPEEFHEEEEDEVYEFEERHDLARGLQGVHLPPVWLVREGDAYWMATKDVCVLRTAAEVLGTLSDLGDAISERVRLSNDERADAAIDAWSRRQQMSPLELAEAATGLPSSTLNEVASYGDLFTPGVGRGEPRPTEILAVARMMSGALSPSNLRAALRAVTSVPKVDTTRLDALSDEALSVVDLTHPGKPWAEGHRLAAWFRNRVGVDDATPINPATILNSYGVAVDDVDIPDDRLDALACWGPKHGPGVIVNTSGRHAQGSAGRRATLAHELCHILIDRQGALPVSEVLNGRAPWRIEARARAFAAELLLPRSVAARAISDPDAHVEEVVGDLCSRYGVSQELAAWQIRNSGVILSAEQKNHLRHLVSDPESF